MTLRDRPSIPSEDEPAQNYAGSARARRRRAHRMIIPQDADGQAALLGALARRAYPSYELFIFALLSGAVLGLGYLLDSQAVLLLGILLAPLMTPWVGMLLAALIGSPRFFFETFMAIFIAAVLVFLCGLMTGFASRLFSPLTFNNAFFHSRLWYPELIALALGAILLIVSFVRSETRPYLPSVVIAYALFLPISASGFGLGSGVQGLWPQGALVFVTHFALASLIGLLTLFALRLRPALGGIFFSAAVLIASVVILVFLVRPGIGFALSQSPAQPSGVGSPALPSPTVELVAAPQIESSSQPVSTPLLVQSPEGQTATPFEQITSTPVPLTIEVTMPPTETPTVTLTIEPTPALALVRAREGGGVVLRERPAGAGLTTLENYTVVEVLPDTMEVNGTMWAHVIANQNGVRREGWVVQLFLEMATPLPDWQPSATPTITSTP